MKIAADGSAEYKGAIDVLVKVCKQEGVFALWKGFWPYYFRLGPHTVIFPELFTLHSVLKSISIHFRSSHSSSWSSLTSLTTDTTELQADLVFKFKILYH